MGGKKKGNGILDKLLIMFFVFVVICFIVVVVFAASGANMNLPIIGEISNFFIKTKDLFLNVQDSFNNWFYSIF